MKYVIVGGGNYMQSKAFTKPPLPDIATTLRANKDDSMAVIQYVKDKSK